MPNPTANVVLLLALVSLSAGPHTDQDDHVVAGGEASGRQVRPGDRVIGELGQRRCDAVVAVRMVRSVLLKWTSAAMG